MIVSKRMACIEFNVRLLLTGPERLLLHLAVFLLWIFHASRFTTAAASKWVASFHICSPLLHSFRAERSAEKRDFVVFIPKFDCRDRSLAVFVVVWRCLLWFGEDGDFQLGWKLVHGQAMSWKAAGRERRFLRKRIWTKIFIPGLGIQNPGLGIQSPFGWTIIPRWFGSNRGGSSGAEWTAEERPNLWIGGILTKS